MEIKNIGFLVPGEKGKNKTKALVMKKESELSFDCTLGCTLYGVKQKKGGNGHEHGTSRCIVTKIDEENLEVISFNLITGEKIFEHSYKLGDIVVFPLPVLIGLSEAELGVLKSGVGFPDSIRRENFVPGERRPEFVRNLGKFTPLVRTSWETEE